MAPQSRYHIAAVRNHRSWKHKSLQNNDVAQLGGKEFRTRKEGYEQRNSEQLIIGDGREGQNVAHNIRLREVEAILGFQSKQLLKLAVCQNHSLEPVEEEEKIAQEQIWKEMLRPTEEILNTIHNQIQQI
ncbi:uncharacterized protein Z519_12718 [Cladophialophora bantiana CBS 173.52]|uniref:Uncharacterized protein n=1 Tax=Cladophialophora bantiana (strain ATCC 10958 / CBS 173.52 / CDC B-1940 / NIH 8579) TaxID=1442370 RepID=A0A0D2H056_CLAB1|nr:uncharacterized protein Z519_12718 [Cladophialophora bantiana CBS 173.52]KIW86663.1 hypothetical protein Z519_12718 [Cladophialophora bantiana CBS 173.52]